MTPTVFLDTNVIMRHVLNDDPKQSPKATAYLRRVESGEITVATTDIVIFEAVFLLERRYRRSKRDIRTWLLPLIELPSVILPGKRRIEKVFELYVDKNMSFPDAFHAVTMGQLGIDQIATFDKGFDKIPGIKRIPS